MRDMGFNTPVNASKQIGCIYTQHVFNDTTLAQPAFTCSMSTMETLEQCVKSVQT